MDVETQASAGIERRSKEREKANELEEMWRESERKHHTRLQQEHQALWYEFHMHLADNLAALSEEHRVQAEQLLEGREVPND